MAGRRKRNAALPSRCTRACHLRSYHTEYRLRGRMADFLSYEMKEWHRSILRPTTPVSKRESKNTVSKRKIRGFFGRSKKKLPFWEQSRRAGEKQTAGFGSPLDLHRRSQPQRLSVQHDDCYRVFVSDMDGPFARAHPYPVTDGGSSRLRSRSTCAVCRDAPRQEQQRTGQSIRTERLGWTRRSQYSTAINYMDGPCAHGKRMSSETPITNQQVTDASVT
ncbi:paired amphipathic helix protein Sin3a [Pseudozyma hubeiensis SY62]|uniref:Paired amphipathic helix protein Sin3a n=1 Tax=Pseudozyma hubeiensis (strain SY62) TaxID=1305764 RepID=R9PBX8_PSEHS|nr:paired amphipathic helix protein Sin3a [Pseudozyma hubeiensis SY62]GAC98913.1 paired amphipathic helix protein Sin3a [Pseudozyma hubeiensis SY62]